MTDQHRQSLDKLAALLEKRAPSNAETEDLLTETMRFLLRSLRADLARRLRAARSADERLSAIIGANFDDAQFNSPLIRAWLASYLEAQFSPKAARLLRLYHRRLHSNLVHCFHACGMGRTEAYDLAESAAALIDGAWLRYALNEHPPDPAFAASEVERRVRMLMGP